MASQTEKKASLAACSYEIHNLGNMKKQKNRSTSAQLTLITLFLISTAITAGTLPNNDETKQKILRILPIKQKPNRTPQQVSWVDENCSPQKDYYECKDIAYKAYKNIPNKDVEQKNVEAVKNVESVEHIEHKDTGTQKPNDKNIQHQARDTKSLKLDVYLPKDFNKHTKPVMIIHGGCFYLGDKSERKAEALRLVKAGFAAVPINYTLANEKPYPAAFEDAKDAVKWIQNKLAPSIDIRSDWIAAFGDSAGGTLASYLGTRAENSENKAIVNVVIDLYGRIDFTLPPAKNIQDDCPSIFAGKQNPQTKVKDENIDRTLYAPMSVTASKNIKPASFFIAHSLNDTLVDVEHSNILFKNLYQIGGKEADIELRIVPGNLHGFTKHSETFIWRKLIRFLKAH